MSTSLAINDNTFEQEVLQSDLPVLVDFWAPWCGPCKMIAPLIDKIAADYNGKLKVVKMNVDDNTETPARFAVRGIPTLILFQEGKATATKVGALSPAQLTSFLDEHL